MFYPLSILQFGMIYVEILSMMKENEMKRRIVMISVGIGFGEIV